MTGLAVAWANDLDAGAHRGMRRRGLLVRRRRGRLRRGETLPAPTLPAIVNDLAPERLRGRYNGGFTLAFTAGFVAGPLLCGQVLDAAGPAALCLLLVRGCAVATVLAGRLRRLLAPGVDRVPGLVPAAVTR